MKKYIHFFFIFVIILSFFTGCTSTIDAPLQAIADKYITDIENAGYINTVTHEKIDTDLRKVPGLESYFISGTTGSKSGEEIYITIEGTINGQPFKVIKTGTSKQTYVPPQ